MDGVFKHGTPALTRFLVVSTDSGTDSQFFTIRQV